jgi:hypothetical protein
MKKSVPTWIDTTAVQWRSTGTSTLGCVGRIDLVGGEASAKRSKWDKEGHQ